MGCKKGAPGKPCCCCLNDADYTSWDYEPGDCCRVCEFVIVGDPWTLICSDPIRTDTRSAEAEYKYYTTMFPVVTGAMPAWPPCPTAKTLCATLQETHEIEVIERLMLRYRKVSQSSSIAKIAIKCNGEAEPVCRWVVSSQICLEVQYGQFEFRSEDHDITGTGSTCCSIAGVLLSLHTPAPTCAEKAALGFPSSTTVCIKRLKIFNTAPSGEITFTPADWVECEDLGLCIRSGVQDFEIVSTDFGADPWVAPACANLDHVQLMTVIQNTVDWCCAEDPGFADGLFVGQTQTSLCMDASGDCECLYTWDGTYWVLTSGDCNYTPVDICYVWHTEVNCDVDLGYIIGELLSVPGVGYSCDDLCGAETYVNGYVSEVTCTLLSTPYHPTPTYTERTLGITLPDWTIDLGVCA